MCLSSLIYKREEGLSDMSGTAREEISPHSHGYEHQTQNSQSVHFSYGVSIKLSVCRQNYLNL